MHILLESAAVVVLSLVDNLITIYDSPMSNLLLFSLLYTTEFYCKFSCRRSADWIVACECRRMSYCPDKPNEKVYQLTWAAPKNVAQRRDGPNAVVECANYCAIKWGPQSHKQHSLTHQPKATDRPTDRLTHQPKDQQTNRPRLRLQLQPQLQLRLRIRHSKPQWPLVALATSSFSWMELGVIM